jgi:hypothetical protein
MKLAIFALAAATTASASSVRSSKATLLSKSRRVEENAGDDAAAEDEYAFLGDYQIKMVSCVSDQTYKNPESGEMEYGAVVYKLCPKDDCDDDSANGCKNGGGTFVTGLNSYVEEWLQDKQEDMNGDDDFKIEEYSECKQYEVDNDADDENAEQAVYYVGPTCGEDGASISLGFFSDYTCQTKPEDVTFEDISNGWSLPYSSNLVTNACESCAGYNDNGEYEVAEMCTQLYQFSGKCESDMETFSQYGKDESACEYIQEIMPKSTGSGGAVGWSILVLVVVGAGAYGYTTWWVKRKNSANMDGQMS